MFENYFCEGRGTSSHRRPLRGAVMRAQRSNPSRAPRKNGLPRRFAPRNDDKRDFAIRGAMRPSRWIKFPSAYGGAGNAGCTLHPRSRVQDCAKNAHRAYSSAEASDIPCAMVTAMPRSPRRRSSCTVAAGLWRFRPGRIVISHRQLDTATGCRTTRFCRTLQRRSSGAPLIRSRKAALRPHLRARRCRVHRIPSQRSWTTATPRAG